MYGQTQFCKFIIYFIYFTFVYTSVGWTVSLFPLHLDTNKSELVVRKYLSRNISDKPHVIFWLLPMIPRGLILFSSNFTLVRHPEYLPSDCWPVPVSEERQGCQHNDTNYNEEHYQENCRHGGTRCFGWRVVCTWKQLSFKGK